MWDDSPRPGITPAPTRCAVQGRRFFVVNLHTSCRRCAGISLETGYHYFLGGGVVQNDPTFNTYCRVVANKTSGEPRQQHTKRVACCARTKQWSRTKKLHTARTVFALSHPLKKFSTKLPIVCVALHNKRGVMRLGRPGYRHELPR